MIVTKSLYNRCEIYKIFIKQSDKENFFENNEKCNSIYYLYYIIIMILKYRIKIIKNKRIIYFK